MARNDQESPQQLELSLDSRYLNIEQVAAILGVPKSFIYRRTARGHGDPIPQVNVLQRIPEPQRLQLAPNYTLVILMDSEREAQA